MHAVAERCSFHDHLTFDSSCFRWQAAVAERLVAPFVDVLGVCTIARQQKQVLRSSYFAFYKTLHLYTAPLNPSVFPAPNSQMC